MEGYSTSHCLSHSSDLLLALRVPLQQPLVSLMEQVIGEVSCTLFFRQRAKFFFSPGILFRQPLVPLTQLLQLTCYLREGILRAGGR